MDNFTQLQAWKVGLEIVKEIYALTKKFPRSEMYALTSQVQKSSTSVLANIAEGYGRYTFPDKAGKYIIARGECTETEAHVRIAVALGFITEKDAQSIINNIYTERRLLSGLIAACRKHDK